MEYNDLSKPASAATCQIHQAMKTLLDFDDPHEKECALRNCLKKVENLEIKNAEGEVIWSQRIACLDQEQDCLLYTSPSPRDRQKSRMPSSA